MKVNYDNFVKMYYYKLMKKLRKFQNYSGQINTVLKGPLVLQNNAYHLVENDNDFLPCWDINVNEKLEIFEDYLEYLVTTLPDLAPCVYDKEMLQNAYKCYVDQPKVEIEIFLEEIINIGIEILVKTGVLN